jgi:hypothetical protein
MWRYDEARGEYVCPEPDCGHRIGWAACDDPAAIARADDQSDPTKVMLVLEQDHVEAAHWETIDVTVACTSCGAVIDPLATFPGGVCVDCHAKSPEGRRMPTADEIVRAWSNG